MAINHVNYDWESIQIVTPGGVLLGAVSVTYKDEAKVENVYGKGRVALGRARGNYSASGSLDVLRDSFNRLTASLGADFLGKKDFTVIVSYANDGGSTCTDTLQGAVITADDASMNQGDKEAKVKMELSIEKILWDGLEPVVQQ